MDDKFIMFMETVDEQYQKCRYMAFQPTLSEENNPYIKQFLEKEFGHCHLI